MTLEDFRAVADEATLHVQMSDECARKILVNCRKQPQQTVAKGVWISAAACLVIMAVSAGMLISGSMAEDQGQEALPNNAGAVQLSMAKDGDVPKKDLPVRYPDEEPPVEVGKYNNTEYAPAKGANGLWGYVDVNGNWVILPEYTSAQPVDGISGRVLTDNNEEIVVILSGHGTSRIPDLLVA